MNKFRMVIKKIFEFIKKSWKWLLPILTTISGVIVGLLLRSNNNSKSNYIDNGDGTITVPDPENDSMVTVETPVKKPDSASLPTDVKNDGEVTINHETTDRKNPNNKPIANSAYTHLRRD
jgi:hypothetical protein